MNKYDVVVVGLGAMGSASLYQLSKEKGLKILGVDQFHPPHSFGSSHGDTRITRQAIGEGKDYAQLVMRANEIWKNLEYQTSERLLVQNGVLVQAAESNSFLNETIKSAKEYRITHQILDTKTLKARFPQFKLTNEVGYFEPTGGYLLPEKCIKVQLKLAQDSRAEVIFNQKVESITKSKEGTLVKVNGTEVLTKKVIVTVGAWINNLLSIELQKFFNVHRQILYWFDVERSYESYSPDIFPTFIWEWPKSPIEGIWGIYGFPAVDGSSGGIKIASEQYRDTSSADHLDRIVREDEIKSMYENFIYPYFNGVTSKCIRSMACMYTVTPDSNFVIDTLPENNDIIIASPCSGHGFKHSAAIGELLSQLALEKETIVDIDKFSFRRFI